MVVLTVVALSPPPPDSPPLGSSLNGSSSPAPPTGVTAVALDSQTVRVSWRDERGDRDEYDVEEASVEQEEGRRFWVPGRLTVDELSESVGHDFHREGVTTGGGLVYELLGRVPEAGEKFVIDGFRVVIERVVKRRIERVYFERAEQMTGGLT